MMNAAFNHDGIDGVYLAFGVAPDRIGQAVLGLQALGAGGVNVTIPHKQTVIPWMSRLSDEAQLAGAVNTVCFDPDTDEVVGHNTDVSGWWESVKTAIQSPIQSVSILGAGGAARAVVAALSLYAPKAKVYLLARNAEQANQMARDFSDRSTVIHHPWNLRHQSIQQAELIVNTTPIGMWPNEHHSPIEDEGCFQPGQVVQDIVYRPLRTRLMQQAEQRGANVVDGLSMLVAQGASAYERWLKRKAPVDVMQRAAYQHVTTGLTK